MSRLLVWLFVCALLPAAAVVVVAGLALEQQPLVVRGDGPSAESIARARTLLRRNDPRRLPRDATGEIQIGAADLEAVLNLAGRRFSDGKAALRLGEGSVEVDYTAPLPARLAGHLAPVGLGRHLNVRTRVSVADGHFAVEALRIGRLPVPARLADALVAMAIEEADLPPEIGVLSKAISRLTITPQALRLTYMWQPGLLDSARDLALGPIDRDGLAAAQARLVELMDRAGRGRAALPLAELLGPLLHQAEPGADVYRQLLLVAALQLSGHNPARLIPEAARWPRPHPLALTLGGRVDLAQHFVVSAAIAAWAGNPLSRAIGLDKEIGDARGGSGFSFVDLTADRAGTRFGELAIREPARIADAVAAGLTDASLLPAVADLPEGLQDDEFRQRFGGIDSPAYRRISDEIDRRVAALALFR